MLFFEIKNKQFVNLKLLFLSKIVYILVYIVFFREN